MGYEWGGQDFGYVEDGVVDCSGLVINVYKEACEKNEVGLPFEYITVSELYSRYTIPITDPGRGDLIFMGDGGVVSHVAIFHQYSNSQIEFLDAYSVSGTVGVGQYSASDRRVIAFGRMLVE